MSDFDMDNVFGGMMDDEPTEKTSYQYEPVIKKEDLSMDLKRVATDFDVLMHTVKDQHAKRLNEELMSMSGREFVQAYLSILAFAQPKFKSVDVAKPTLKKRELKLTHHTIKK